MTKTLGFRDTGVAGVDCDFVALGETEEELFRNALEHGRTFHGMEDIPKHLQERMRKFIREEKTASISDGTQNGMQRTFLKIGGLRFRP
ncbi:DUF1059 domain-containing protein [Candidatus Deferrimicrobium sp.]|uniref:DUF1059 domain-containing protein n=1 Tax=Candidatus Deferrimicrobium sp. TaxID=3060586 RepID=UPI0039C88062